MWTTRSRSTCASCAERQARTNTTVPTSLPDMPDYIEGVMDYLGRVVPVVNLRRRFELPVMDADAQTRTLILNVTGEWIGVVVDSVTEVAPFDPAAVAPPPRLFRG